MNGMNVYQLRINNNIKDDLCVLLVPLLDAFLQQPQHRSTLRLTQNFKLRLINQQTGDCTDSVILHAGKLTSSTFPVPIKIKGG
jgi:hypothetical protein